MVIDEKRFTELYRQYWGYVLALCRRAINNTEDAEELALLVFARKWRAIHRYDPEKAQFKTWLTTNTVNAIREYLRAPHRVSGPFDGDEDELVDASTDQQTLNNAALRSCLAKLPEDERLVLLMHDLMEFTWEEIALQTAYTVAQARTLRARARKKMRACLEAQDITVDD
ncbi:MAG TPA: sigma-70 family RNA polymerase sigma factor [Armatimonadota bacterium]|nr:sigma-70 family RNA polymerase sigma factor [Armatimonadota bacterium]HOS43158.1 sigma-70 family RNA polymerase sigma factor [Armatimonadota bacterium]